VPTLAADGLALSCMVPVDTNRIVRVHMIFVDIPFMINE
jgi:hypothetical protein